MTDAIGQPVTFDLPGPGYEAVTWLHNEHGGASLCPLVLTIGRSSSTQVGEDGLPDSIRVNGYSYKRTDEWPPSSTLPGHLAGQKLPADDTDLINWRERCLPLVDEVAAEIGAFDPAEVAPGEWARTLRAQRKRIGEVGRLVHDTAVFPAQMFAETFAARYVEVFGEERRAEGLALLQGFPNVSTERAAALWDLGRIARRSAAAMAAVESGALPDGESKDEAEFRRGFEAAMARFGHMAPMGMEDRPRWREDVAVPLGIVRQYAVQGADSDPRRSESRASSRRIELEAKLAKEAGESAEAADLLRLLPCAQHISPVTEDHNMLADQKMLDVSRTRWLKVGELLRKRGLVRQADDVYFYELDELVVALEDGDAVAREELAARKDRQALWRSVAAPALLGRGATNAADLKPQMVVRGMAAAAGVYTGRARVVVTIAEADTLEDGDVLVCDVTTPAWTPYFAVIGAVVTNIGSVLAHGAIVAREFGIPAVVATQDATERIPDGATVTVDGAAGTVTVERG